MSVKVINGYNPVAGEWYEPIQPIRPAAYYKYAKQNIIGSRYPDLVCPNVYTAEDIVAELDAAIDNYAEVKLCADIVLSTAEDESINYIEIPAGKTLEIDLFGHTIESFCMAFDVYGSLIIKDSVGGGKITATATDSYAAIYVEGSEGEGNFTLKSGTIDCACDYTMENPSWCYGIYGLDNGKINITGGEIKTFGASAVASNNTTGDVFVTITGGVLYTVYAPAIYLPSQQDLIIEGDAQILGGVQARMGQIYIDGSAVVKGTAAEYQDLVSDVVKYKSGTITTGDAVSVLAGTFTSDNEQCGNSCSIKVGPKATLSGSRNSVAVYMIDTKYDQNVTIEVASAKSLANEVKVYDHVLLSEECSANSVAYSPVVTSVVDITVAGETVYPEA